MSARLIQWREIPDGGLPELTSEIEAACHGGSYFEFGGGLGDIINSSTRSAVFAQLNEKVEPIVVVLVSHNPNSWEIFGYHPNAKGRLTIVNIPFKEVQGAYKIESPEFRSRYGLPLVKPTHHPIIYGEGFKFHPTREDLLLIESLPHPYVAFATTASNGIVDKRTIPRSIIEDAVSVVLSTGLSPLFVGCNYNINGSEVPHTEVPPPEYVWSHSVIGALSVPGSAEALRRAVVSVVCDSAMGCAAHAMLVPTFALVHDEMWKACSGPEAGHGEIMDPRNYQCSFKAFSSDLLLKYIRRYR